LILLSLPTDSFTCLVSSCLLVYLVFSITHELIHSTSPRLAVDQSRKKQTLFGKRMWKDGDALLDDGEPGAWRQILSLQYCAMLYYPM
jgi:hypothetical protein